MHIKGYIFPKTVRQAYYYCGSISMIGLLGFTIFMYAVGIMQDTDKGACFSVASIFCVLSIYCIIEWIHNWNLMRATYRIDCQTACNATGKTGMNITVSLQKAERLDFNYSFYFASANMDAEYIIFSEKTYNLSTGNIYKIIREIWKAGAVIIPKDGEKVLLSADSQSD